MGYLFLLLTILSETAAVICMKLSGGFHHKGYAAIAVVTYAMSFAFLSLSLKSLHAGIANAIWAGSSAVLVAVLGIFIFHEKLNVVQAVSLLLIVAGLIGLNLHREGGG